jgi:hypothetical protein
MCREFYNRAGEISYRYYQYTVTCADNCHPYRRTENNIVLDSFGENLPQDQCSELSTDPSQIHYDTTSGVCYFCKNNGVWYDQHNACIYMAIPGEGQKCSSAQVGCREYTGNAGSNMRQVQNDDFESGSLNGWTGDPGTVQNLSSHALMAGGQSLMASGNNSAIP